MRFVSSSWDSVRRKRQAIPARNGARAKSSSAFFPTTSIKRASAKRVRRFLSGTWIPPPANGARTSLLSRFGKRSVTFGRDTPTASPTRPYGPMRSLPSSDRPGRRNKGYGSATESRGHAVIVGADLAGKCVRSTSTMNVTCDIGEKPTPAARLWPGSAMVRPPSPAAERFAHSHRGGNQQQHCHGRRDDSHRRTSAHECANRLGLAHGCR